MLFIKCHTLNLDKTLPKGETFSDLTPRLYGNHKMALLLTASFSIFLIHFFNTNNFPVSKQLYIWFMYGAYLICISNAWYIFNRKCHRATSICQPFKKKWTYMLHEISELELKQATVIIKDSFYFEMESAKNTIYRRHFALNWFGLSLKRKTKHFYNKNWMKS